MDQASGSMDAVYTPDLAPKRNIRQIEEHIFPAISQKLHGSPLI
jgi:hypothetical protein